MSAHEATSRAIGQAAAPGRWRRIEALMLGALLVLLALHAVGACLDFVAAIRDPYELDYGEGIVWQQAALIPGPRMYAPGPALPFIVFHYPPLFYLLARSAAAFMPDLLSAGRLVSASAAVSIVPLAGALVLASARTPKGQRSLQYLAIAAAAGLVALSLHAIRTWALFMRVDMVAIALGLAGVLVAAKTSGRLLGTTCALLLCVASVYCKQTQLPAGIAVFVIALLRRPGAAIGAAGISLSVGLVVLALLQWYTAGGFLENIITDNINRFSLQNFWDALGEERASFPFMVLMPVAAAAVMKGLFTPAWGTSWHGIHARLADHVTATRAMILLHFTLATLMLVTMFKSGADFNYLLDWLCVGCVLMGVCLCDLLGHGWPFSAAAGVMTLCLLTLPVRQMPNQLPASEREQQDRLVRRIAQADGPVASENMTLLMRAGKPVTFEPAIATELASTGQWNERPLVSMIEAHGFAFMITTDDSPAPSSRRTPAVDAAMRLAYPRIEQISPELWLHLPKD